MNINGLNENKTRRNILIGLFVMAFGSLIHSISDHIVHFWYPNRPAPVDLIHDYTPYIQPLEYISDIVLVMMVILFLIYLFRYKRNEIALHMVSIGSIYSVRAFLNTITPLGKPLGNESSHGILKNHTIQYGMFPSGHVALTFYLFLIIDSKYKTLKYVMLVLFVIELVTMLLSRGHFSIDVFGAMLLSYSVKKFYETYQKSLEVNL